METSAVAKSHNDTVILHFMMWVTDSQPKDLLTNELLTGFFATGLGQFLGERHAQGWLEWRYPQDR